MREQCRHEHDEVTGVGGLHILGTERHESRRIDNQLRGRAGRQGDPGSSRFFLSLDDDLMRIFGGDRLKGAMQKLGMEENVPIESGMVSRAIERAQKQVEQRNFETRKHLLEYDDVNNKQRQEIYGLRRDLLEGKNQKEYMIEKAREIFAVLMDDYIGSKQDVKEWEIEPFRQQLQYFFGYDPEKDGIKITTMSVEDVTEADLVTPREAVRREGNQGRRRPDAPVRAAHPPPDHRSRVEGPPPRDGPPEGRHRAAGVRPEGPAWSSTSASRSTCSASCASGSKTRPSASCSCSSR